ncbi:uncharacterized protein IUM83_10094 [Phytophthora cinnamomi]|uniref:uncharacterized protein n=1 Tax=Phytophthora cinnamomi TaxID=4785 RepID=UPI00355A4E33|nr:hypothetical protein IUM83_10094 [Phytophthora cinnamomi]
MATWADALNARVLANVSTPELHRSYNVVFEEEFSGVTEALDGVTAAFAKLEEVRNAVSQLNKSTVGHSTSLQAELDSAMRLRQQLKKAVKKVATDLTVLYSQEDKAGNEVGLAISSSQKLGQGLPNQNDKKPEKRTSESLGTPITSDGENTRKDKKKAKKNHETATINSPGSSLTLNPIGSKLQHRTDATKTTGSKSNHETATAVSKISRHNYLIVMAELCELDMLERNKCLPEILQKLAKIVEQIPSSQLQSSGHKILKFVIVWAFRCEAREKLLEDFLHFADAIKTSIYDLPNDSKTVGIRRLYCRLHAFLKGATREVSDAHPEPTKENPTNHDILLWEADFLTSKKRSPLIPQIILAQESEMMRPIVSSEQFREVSKAVNTLAFWAQRERGNLQLNKLFRGLAQSAKLYAGKVPNFTVKANLLGDALRIELAVGRLANWTIRERAQQTLAFVNQLAANPPLEVIDVAILMTDEIIRFVERGWKPTQDRAVRECYSRLKQLVDQLNGPIQHQRQAVLTQWQVDEP